MKPTLLPLLAAVAAGCSAAAPEPVSTAGAITPREAIVAAADAAPAGIDALFALRVQAAGRNGGRVYLNSERDYRDQRNLTINVAPDAASALRHRYGAPPDRFFVGRTIRVRGTARRVRIDFVTDGRPSGRYYYQTHVAVTDPDQISLVDEAG